MKLKVYLEKRLEKALAHQDEHPLSGSANRDVKEARRALAQYLQEVEQHRNTTLNKELKWHSAKCSKKSFQRPSNYFQLASQRQWDIDNKLGILDWEGTGLTKEDRKRFKKHYENTKT